MRSASVSPDPHIAVGMIIVVGIAVGSYNFWLHRDLVEYRRVFPLAAVAYPTVPVGACFLAHVPAETVMISLGFAVIALTLFTVHVRTRLVPWLRRRGIGTAFAALSGLFLGAFSTSGPPIVAYLYASDHDRMRAKANTQFFFAVTAAGGVLTHILAGNVTGYTLARSLPFLPVLIVGTHAGAAAAARLPSAVFSRLTDAALVCVGVYLIAAHLR
ncbi:MAG: sulfite exporter TauE/SafE family protein [Spirochaetaceae bacterium]